MVAKSDITKRFYGAGQEASFRVANPPGATTRNPGATNLAHIIDAPREAQFGREMMTWRTPHLGWVQMYINPQGITIRNIKDVSATRTKAGFIVQYAGEKLTKMTITGTTGSAGMEGINVLEQVYRSEQEAFKPIADSLERSITSAGLLAAYQGATNVGQTGIEILDSVTRVELSASVLDIFEQPFPTLASLAASIEMFFQGVLYKGYFEGFSVEEKATEAGHFSYTIEFTAFAKQGVRRNFMPWHKQPSSPADSNFRGNMSFYGDPVTRREPRPPTTIPPAPPPPEPTQNFSDDFSNQFQPGGTQRDTNNGVGKNGNGLAAQDFRFDIPANLLNEV